MINMLCHYQSVVLLLLQIGFKCYNKYTGGPQLMAEIGTGILVYNGAVVKRKVM